MIRILPLVLLTLSACADVPEVGRAEAKLASSASTPTLLTAEELAALTAGVATDNATGLAAEAAALRARARRLRGN